MSSFATAYALLYNVDDDIKLIRETTDSNKVYVLMLFTSREQIASIQECCCQNYNFVISQYYSVYLIGVIR